MRTKLKENGDNYKKWNERKNLRCDKEEEKNRK